MASHLSLLWSSLYWCSGLTLRGSSCFSSFQIPGGFFIVLLRGWAGGSEHTISSSLPLWKSCYKGTRRWSLLTFACNTNQFSSLSQDKIGHLLHKCMAFFFFLLCSWNHLCSASFYCSGMCNINKLYTYHINPYFLEIQMIAKHKNVLSFFTLPTTFLPISVYRFSHFLCICLLII